MQEDMRGFKILSPILTICDIDYFGPQFVQVISEHLGVSLFLNSSKLQSQETILWLCYTKEDTFVLYLAQSLKTYGIFWIGKRIFLFLF